MHALQQNSRPIPHCAALPQAENLAQQHDDKIKGFRNEQTRCTVTQEHPATVSCEPTPVVEAVAQRLPSAAQGTAAVQGLSEETVVAERRPQVPRQGLESYVWYNPRSECKILK